MVPPHVIRAQTFSDLITVIMFHDTLSMSIRNKVFVVIFFKNGDVRFRAVSFGDGYLVDSAAITADSKSKPVIKRRNSCRSCRVVERETCEDVKNHKRARFRKVFALNVAAAFFLFGSRLVFNSPVAISLNGDVRPNQGRVFIMASH